MRSVLRTRILRVYLVKAFHPAILLDSVFSYSYFSMWDGIQFGGIDFLIQYYLV